MDTPLPPSSWRPVEAAHAARVDELTAAHIWRRDRGLRHPVEDFLFTYYTYLPSRLRQWHPGHGVSLAGAHDRADWRHYQVTDGVARIDEDGFRERHADLIQRTVALLQTTAERPAQWGCFGMHEWAMAYRLAPNDLRHPQLPLRLGAAATEAVVESQPLRCTHFDAFRFFTPAAAPLNERQLTRADQLGTEQPGCLHVGMDLYRAAYRLSPWVPSDLVLDCFLLARQIRQVDMQASPYDVSGLGLQPIPVETADGKAAYVRRQKDFAARAQPLRQRLLAVLEPLSEPARPPVATRR